jgi:hypothetical protein
MKTISPFILTPNSCPGLTIGNAILELRRDGVFWVYDDEIGWQFPFNEYKPGSQNTQCMFADLLGRLYHYVTDWTSSDPDPGNPFFEDDALAHWACSNVERIGVLEWVIESRWG